MQYCLVFIMLLFTFFLMLAFFAIVPGFFFGRQFHPSPSKYHYRKMTGNNDNNNKDYLPEKYNNNGNKGIKKSSSNEGSDSGLFGGIAKLFGQDQQSKDKRKRQEGVNQAVDKVFQDLGFQNAGLVGGLVGGLVKSVAKGVGGLVAEMAAESMGDIEAVQRGVEAILDDDPRSSNVLGEPVTCDQPSASSSSSMSVNGQSQRSVMLVMPVFGSKTNGIVEVSATLESMRGMYTTKQLNFCCVYIYDYFHSSYFDTYQLI